MKKILILIISCVVILPVIVFSAIPDDYQINDNDENGSITKYYGYTKKASDWWVVMRSSTVASVTQYRYAVGDDDYAVNWSSRAALNYYDWADTYSNPN
jgi:hypothetical protein